MYQELYNSQLERFKVSFLTAAARGGRIDEVASLIDFAAGGEDNLDLIKPLQEAIRGQHSEVVSLLFANGADPRCRDDEVNNSLHLVAKVRTRYAVFTSCCGVMIQIFLAQTIAFVSILEDW
jgi:ankyrin repeat protein